LVGIHSAAKVAMRLCADTVVQPISTFDDGLTEKLDWKQEPPLAWTGALPTLDTQDHDRVLTISQTFDGHSHSLRLARIVNLDTVVNAGNLVSSSAFVEIEKSRSITFSRCQNPDHVSLAWLTAG
jgi:hypothetical protein